MINYKRGGRWHLLNICLMRGSLFPQSMIMAGPCAVITFVFKWYDIFGQDTVLLNSTAWSGFSALVGFLVVFRTSEAYSRFWDGCTATHQMRAEWIDAASAIMAFCRHSTAPQDEIERFKHLAVRLFSLLHAMALGEIEECEDLEQVMAFDLELIDPCGLDKESWRILQKCDNKVTLVFTWLQTVIVENISTGILTIPAPILSRVFQELANGMVALHEAQKIASIPFPFPYAQTCDALLFLHWLVTPVVTAQYTANYWWACVFGFVQVFILWSLNNIAVEIEHPFGNDANDLDASKMQLEMNMSLLLVLHPAATRAPVLSPEAQIHGLVNMGRHASQALHALNSGSYNAVIGSGHAERESDASRQSGSLRCVRQQEFWSSAAALQDPCTTDFARAEPTGSHRDSNPSQEADPELDAVMLEVPSAETPAHMDPTCSQPVTQQQLGDVDPNPELGSPCLAGQPAGHGGPPLRHIQPGELPPVQSTTGAAMDPQSRPRQLLPVQPVAGGAAAVASSGFPSPETAASSEWRAGTSKTRGLNDCITGHGGYAHADILRGSRPANRGNSIWRATSRTAPPMAVTESSITTRV